MLKLNLKSSLKHNLTRGLLAAGLALFQLSALAQVADPATAAVVVPAAEANANPASAGLVMVTAVAVFLLALVLVLAVIVLYQAKPLLRKLYLNPVLHDTWSGRVLGLFIGDPVVLTGRDLNQVMEAHDYDGIQEYDNDLPPWWKALFLGSIGFAVVYLVFFHVTKTGALTLDEYRGEMAQAALLTQQLGANDDPNKITDFKPMLAGADLAAGQAVFVQNCAACHGKAGEGSVGPNLTDEYWLHGGEVNKVYHTIKYGVQSKGMIAWKGKLTGKQLLQTASYVLSLHGSNPANGKAPQGERETPAGTKAPAADPTVQLPPPGAPQPEGMPRPTPDQR